MDMENNQKPEWFELADNDQPVSRPLKKKSAPMRSLTFIVAGILVIPMGAGVALLTHEAQPVSGAETLNLTQDSPAATSPAQIQPNSAITMPTVSRDDDDDEDDDDRAPIFSSASISPTVLAPIAPTATSSNSKAPAVKAPAAITPPGSTSNDLILPPTKKAGHDDDDEDDEEEEEEEEEEDDDDDEEDDD
jgi:cytoskeletal protein RodZ